VAQIVNTMHKDDNKDDDDDDDDDDMDLQQGTEGVDWGSMWVTKEMSCAFLWTSYEPACARVPFFYTTNIVCHGRYSGANVADWLSGLR